MKIREVIAAIENFHPKLSPREAEHTCDVFKCGDPEAECTGVAVTCYASYQVIRTAAENGLNLIIVHEPVFYRHMEEPWEDNSVYDAKRALIAEHGITIWRDHDHIHAGPQSHGRVYPDYIFIGLMKTLGWEKYVADSPLKPLMYEIPQTTVRGLTDELLRKLNLRGARIIGDADAPVRKVYIVEHLRGNDGPFGGDSEKIECAERQGVDVMIPLETVDWTLLEYVIDSCQTGRARAVISMGHFNLEEGGMKYMAEWLSDLLDGALPVRFLQSGDIYSYITRE